MNEENYGDAFQQKSKYIRNELPNHYLDWKNKPDEYKEYINAIKVLKLPLPDFKKDIPFWNVISNRHSTRNFSQDPISINELSLLLFGMSGLTRIHPSFAFRTVPSAGGLFPIESYIICNHVYELERGLYHYNIKNHSLELLKKGDFRDTMSGACLDQKMVFNAAINIVWAAIIQRSRWKYLQRCYRYIYMDAGHIAQNFYLIAEALDLGACTVGAIYDDELNEFLNLDGNEETAIYVGILGKKKRRK